MPAALENPPAATAREQVWNLPNQITLLRLVLSVALFVLIDVQAYLASAILFALAASTDWVDGFIARRYGMCTQLGRMLDPFVDKIIVCGTFIYLAAVPATLSAEAASSGTATAPLTSGVAAWMVVVVIGRELLVTALRSFLEQQGANFSANMSGKLKMVTQCVAATAALFGLHWQVAYGPLPAWLLWTRDISVGAAVALTVFSGAIYVDAAIKLATRDANAG